MLRRFLYCVIILSLSQICFAQAATEIKPSNDTGLKPLTPYSTGGGNVNLTNGNLNLEIPLVGLPGRAGMNYTLSLTYDSKIWTPRATYASPVDITYTWSDSSLNGGSGDWRLNIPSITPGTWLTDANGNHSGNSDYIVTLMSGAKHALGRTGYFNLANWSRDAEDGSGLNIDLSNSSDTVVRDKAGIAYHFGNGTGDVTNIKVQDTNGNFILFSNSGVTDTLGRTIGISYTGYRPQSITYHDSDGIQRTISFTYTNLTILTGSSPHFSYPQQHTCNGYQNCTNIYVSQPSNVLKSVLSTVTLADNSQYTFSYNDYGELSKIVFPTGGYAKYEYGAYQHQETFWNYSSGTCNDYACLYLNIQSDFREVTKKSVCSANVGVNGTCPAEEVTVYMPSTSSSVGSNTTSTVYEGVTDSNLPPQSYLRRTVSSFTTCDQSDLAFSRYCSPHDAGSAIYEFGGSTPIKSTTIAYNTYGNYPLLPATITTSYNGGPASTEQLSYDTQTVHVLRPLGQDYSVQTFQDVTMFIDNVTQRTVTDFGGSTPIRKEVSGWLHTTSYTNPSPHILNRKAEEWIYDGSNNLFADTQYEYDNYTEPITESHVNVGHDSTYNANLTVRGNLTAIKKWLNTSNSYLTTRYQYDDAGNATKQTDPGGHWTLMDYSDHWGHNGCGVTSAVTNAYLTGVQREGIDQWTHASYNGCTGTMQSYTDLNSQQTTWTYDVLGRVTDIHYPDTGEIQLAYPTPNTVYRQQKQDETFWITGNFTLDGRGRIIQTDLSDPEGDVFTDTTYDSLGRVYTASNPHRSAGSGTDGITTTSYDALDRVVTIVRPDDAPSARQRVQTTYAGNCTTETDETGRQRKSCSDALGRLTSVIEPNKTTGSLTSGFYPTYYTYDPLGNLLAVNQQGDGTGDHNRTFTYDSLSRLLTANNPESATVNYAYTPDSTCNPGGESLRTKTDARGITTTYCYETLHRLKQKDYTGEPSPGTPSAYFDYDSAEGWPLEHAIGRLVRTRFASGINTEIFSYDPMGRMKHEYANRQSNFNISWFETNAEYDKAGHITSLTYPSGRKVAFGYTPYWGNVSAGRLLTVDFTAFNGTTVNQRYWTAVQTQNCAASQTCGYWPHGARLYSYTGDSSLDADGFNPRLQQNAAIVVASGSFNINPLNRWFSTHYSYIDSGHNNGNNGNVMQISDDLNSGRTQNFSYDQLNRIATASQFDPNGWGQTYNIDPWGNLLAQNTTKGLPVPPNPQPLCVTSAPNNRLGLTCGQTTVYQYDAAGDMTWDGNYAYQFDAEGRVKTVNNGSAAIYTYDADGNRVRKDNADGSTEYIYFGAEVIGEKNVTTGDWTDYIYANGKRIAKSAPASYQVRFKGTNPGSQETIGWESCRWGNTGCDDAFVVQSGDKLVFSEVSTQPHGGMFFYYINAQGQEVSSIGLVSDTNGCALTEFCGPVSWMGRVVSLESFVGRQITHMDFYATPNSGGWWETRYKDVALVRADGTVRPIFNGQTTLPGWYVFNYSAATAAIEWVAEPATNTALTTSYYHGDHLGTSRVITSGYGYPIWQGTFLPYGAEFSPQTAASHYKFTGKERDSETGLDYFGARYYGSTMGRFTSPDPKTFTERHVAYPQKWNKYAYVQNNPLAFIDPDGLDDWYIFRPLVKETSAGTGNWTAAVKAAEARGDHVYMLKGPKANVQAYNTALQTPGAHVVAVTHADSQHGGAITLYDGISSGSNGSESRSTTQSADPSKGITETITGTNSFTITAKEVAVFGCDSQGLKSEYSDTTYVGMTPGPDSGGGISYWLGGNGGAAFLQANGGQSGVDAVNALVPNSPDARDKGATAKLNPPERKKDPEEK